MELPHLITQLCRPEAVPFAVDRVELRQTHISMVFLAGDVVYKVKKPVTLPFLDFSTIERRRHFCDEEVRLNRRLAPSVYLGVVPVTKEGDRIAFEGTGEVIDWAVKMRRLPEDATLLHQVHSGTVTPATIVNLARRLARFHLLAERNDPIASFGSFEVVAQNIRENFNSTRDHIGETVTRRVFDRVEALTEKHLQISRDRIESRSESGYPCETHGDLHLDHVYLFPEIAPPGDLVIIDGIEFNERFRYADPVSDIAFVVMDLQFHGRRDLARLFAESYFTSSLDREGSRLLPLYAAYRAMVRAKVEGITAREAEIDPANREKARRQARAHWLLALGELEAIERRPALLLVGGLPGAGKSTLTKELARVDGWSVIRTDVVRKELAKEPSEHAGYQQGLYAPEMTRATYDECRRRAEGLLAEGERVIIDASFADDAERLACFDLGRSLAVPVGFVRCEVSRKIALERIRGRRGDASDADEAIHDRLARDWQPLSAEMEPFHLGVTTDRSPAESAEEVRLWFAGLVQGAGPSFTATTE